MVSPADIGANVEEEEEKKKKERPIKIILMSIVSGILISSVNKGVLLLKRLKKRGNYKQ